MEKYFLTFDHCGARYALEVAAVRQIVWLPELSPIEELPHYICGVFNLHGQVLPVMDLCLRFGHVRRPYRLSDRVIVIEGAMGRVGILADDLQQVVGLDDAAINPAPAYQGAGGVAQFVAGQVKLDDGLAMLLDVPALLRSAPGADALAMEPAPSSAEQLAHLYGRLSQTEIQTLRSRAQALAGVAQSDSHLGLQSYAVVSLADELFGLELDHVIEFSPLRHYVPVPCCPPHIVGNMNLRGDILTLLDLRPALGLPMQGELSEVVVVRVGQISFGLLVAKVVALMPLAPGDIADVPLAADANLQRHCRGVTTRNGQTVSLLDLEQIIATRRLHVAEHLQ
jgi:purine-binding chemotaxis protein CheW